MSVARPALPGRVAVIGAAGGLGRGILDVCRAEGVGFSAIVRSRPERIVPVPEGSRVAVVADLADVEGLATAFEGADAVLTATGVTATSRDRSALLSRNLDAVEEAMQRASVDRIVAVNSLIAAAPGEAPSVWTRLFAWVPGLTGRGARELQALPLALGRGAWSSLRWTLVRAGINARGKDVPAVAALRWSEKRVSLQPVSFASMGRWMLEEAAADRYVRAAPLVSSPR